MGRADPRSDAAGQNAAAPVLRLFVSLTVTFGALSPSSARAGEPDPTNASLLSASTTLVPLAVGTGLLLGGRQEQEGFRLTTALTTLAVGAVVGPSTGQLYAGAGIDAITTMLIRALTGGMALGGLTLTLRGSEDEQSAGIALLVLGAIPTAILAVYDIVDASNTARESRIRTARIEPEELRALHSVAACGPLPCATRLVSASANEGQGP